MKVFVFVSLIIVCFTSYAQRAGIIMGLDLSNLLIKNDDSNLSKDREFKMNPGGHLGIVVEIPIYKILSFETGVIATTKGFKNKTSVGPVTVLVRDYLFYVDFPLKFKTTFDLKALMLYAEFGPYLGVGLYGFTHTETTIGSNTDSDTDEVEWGSDETDDLRRFDMGLTFGAGIDFGTVPIFIGASYDLGLINMSPNSDNGFRINNRTLKISLGVKFGKR